MPQWNCGCAICEAARRGIITPQTQPSVAVGDDSGNWYLVNASPDLSLQLRSHAELAPRPESRRNSPIAGVLLTSADIDHVLGLASLREGNPLHLYATPAVEKATALLGIETVLRSFCGIVWHEPEERSFGALRGNDGEESSIRVRAIPLSGSAPRYAAKIFKEGDFTVALQFLDQRTKGRLLVAPGVGNLTAPLQEAARDSQAVLMDGTFWCEDELRQVRPEAPNATDMGHLPIQNGTLPFLRALSGRRIYIHINNTNPIFLPDSPERAAVESAGIMVGFDGFQFEL